MKVLIIEPDWRFAQQATAYLESHAHLTVHETSAQCGLAKATHWQPDLVIAADVFADEGLLESLAGLADTPAVLLTGWMDRYDVAWRAWQMPLSSRWRQPNLPRWVMLARMSMPLFATSLT